MIKNIVTISLSIFIILVVGVLGASVFVGQPKNTQINTPAGNIAQNSNAGIITGDDDNNSDDEEDENGTGNVVNPTPNPTPPATTPATTITLAQVAQHNTYNNCWMIINSKVYNVTSYLSAHPGGSGSMIPYCGKEATVAFDTKGGKGSHSQSASGMLTNYYVGSLTK